jgi:uncharacterized protein YjbI with pentapeptide repeats
MASGEHLQLIRQGAEVWNEWRQKNRELIPRLLRADLGSAKLRVDLSGAVLGGADLSEANLSRADLRYAKLIGADLSGTSKEV